MLAYERPIGIRLLRKEGKGEISRPELWFSRCYGCAHEAGCCVDEDADWCFAIGGVGDGIALEETVMLSVMF